MNSYWTYQILGWLAYAAVGITINLLNGVHLRTLMFTHVIFIASGIGMTHLFRREIRRRRPRPQKLTGMRMFLTAGVLLIGAIQTGVVIMTDIAVEPASREDWTKAAVAATWYGMTLGVGVWTMLYVRVAERRGQAARESELQLGLREAELRVLESQINPHFLFNCLNSIRALVALDGPRAQDMLTRLANVLRHSLRHERQHTVRLDAEVDAMADYLALEAVRFEDRMRVEVKVDPALNACPLPPMLLQTLVENAIKHGIGQVTGRGDLTVRAERQDGFLRLVVENTGQLREAAAASTPMGLANIRERLRLLYGDRASLRLEDGNGRVTATVLIPAVG
jgi:two-component system, LytTR family, sensor kinase